MAAGIPHPLLTGQAKGVSYYWFPDPFAPSFDDKWTVGPPKFAFRLQAYNFTQKLSRFKSLAHKPSKFLELNSTGKLLVRKTGRLVVFLKRMGKPTLQNKWI